MSLKKQPLYAHELLGHIFLRGSSLYRHMDLRQPTVIRYGLIHCRIKAKEANNTFENAYFQLAETRTWKYTKLKSS